MDLILLAMAYYDTQFHSLRVLSTHLLLSSETVNVMRRKDTLILFSSMIKFDEVQYHLEIVITCQKALLRPLV